MICRFCGSSRQELVIDLGKQPLANSFLRSPKESEKTYPLDVYFCQECGILQIGTTIPPEDIFTEYLYFSGTSTTIRDHAKWMAKEYTERFKLAKRSFVVEVASNDGTVLKEFDTRKLGVEPAKNIAREAIKAGVPTYVDFFNEQTATHLTEQYGKADLIIARHVFAHVPNINSFVAGLKQMLATKGTIVIESPYAVDMINKREFDTIYHEHVFYLLLRPMAILFNKYGLEIYDVERIPIQGGSMLVYVGQKREHVVSDRYMKLLDDEMEQGFDSSEKYTEFRHAVRDMRVGIRKQVSMLKHRGKRIVAYGAAAKGNTLLNYTGVGEYLDYVVDKSPYKVGLYTPGSHLLVKSVEEFRKDHPDCVLLLAWNFLAEIEKQESEYIAKGGKFLIPSPERLV